MDCNRGFSVLYMKFRTMGNIISTFKDDYYCGGTQSVVSRIISILRANRKNFWYYLYSAFGFLVHY